MSKKMLIDATHDEETRVAIVDGDRLEEYDYESAFRKALKGNIYLAKVTRVEPSLQAAFVNFGGNRHGFLPFSEIHPDYFRIPISDRQALIEQEEGLDKDDEDEDDIDGNDDEDETDIEDDSKDDVVTIDPDSPAPDVDDDDIDDDEDEDEPNGNVKEPEPSEEDDPDGNTENAGDDDKDGNAKNRRGNQRGGKGRRGRGRNMAKRNRDPELVDKDEKERKNRFNLRRKYKIQEVIKRGQIMLVQISKEERGNKGAAASTYLSLPGRYCVLMPNSPRAGGVSRKIANNKDRAKMRDMLKQIEVPKGMSVIMRTAGVTRTKAEIKRDLSYLTRLWDKIRELTLESTAPALVYEEADLIKRAVRDLYTRDVEEIYVAGDEGFKTAKTFMKMMIPSHAKRVIEYKDDVPLFTRYHVENQINEMSSPTATMKSGGYLVINPTEALVSIDVNSGKSTKERHIEGTALKTNLEAADEVARQLRLRDLGGLVVVDFIDMEDRRNNAKVERRLREALSGDRARIQVGRISSFGLLELSRQRLNPSLTEAQFEICPHCEGTGNIRTPDATSVLVIRAIEEEGIKGRASQLIVHVTSKVALYLLNSKRQHLSEMEKRYNFEALIRVDDELPASDFRLEVSRRAGKDDGNDDDEDKDNNSGPDNRNTNADNNDDNKKNEGGRRRGRRGGRRRRKNDNDGGNDNDSGNNASDNNQEQDSDASDNDADNKKQRRGGRNQKQDDGDKAQDSSDQKQDEAAKDEKAQDDKSRDDKPKGGRKRSNAKKSEAQKTDQADQPSDDKKEDKPAAKKRSPKTAAKKKAEGASDTDKEDKPAKASEDAKNTDKSDVGSSMPEPSNDDQDDQSEKYASQFETINEPPKKKKKGWWNKLVD